MLVIWNVFFSTLIKPLNLLLLYDLLEKFYRKENLEKKKREYQRSVLRAHPPSPPCLSQEARERADHPSG